jgi:hypothetical protein
VGTRSPLRVNGDIRLFTDSHLDAGAALTLDLAAGEGGLLSVREGSVRIEGTGDTLLSGTTVIIPPATEPGMLTIEAVEPSRIIRAVYGPGYGLVREAPRYHSATRMRQR